MTSQSENELLTKVGPGTPMGNLMRQYWLPACLSSEVTPDGDPLRLMLLGERLIAFRDTEGRIGVLDHRCPHRCASLFFGRNEEGGIRCVYHGWKFDTAGNCLEMPNLPPDQDFRTKVKAKSYAPAEPGFTYYRFAHFAMPFWTLFPNGPLEDNIIVQGWVPMDDTHTMTYYFSWKRRTPAPGLLRSGEPLSFLDRATAMLPNTTDWFGRWRPAANQSNDYLIDREAQRTFSYSGIAEVFTQDSAVTESMGAISDRTLEHLAPSDRMITMTRRRLIEAVRALRDHATVPPLVDNPGIASVARSGDLIAPAGLSWLEAYEQTLGHALHPEFSQAAE